MKRQKSKKHLYEETSSEVIQTPAFPVAGNKIFERLGAAVGASRGYSLSNMEFARLMGRPESTASSWFGAYSQPHLVSFFCLLEQLTPQERHRFLDELCRDLPLADHPRLRHDPVTVARLKNLLGKRSGITVIAGGTDSQRTFLLHALGHTFCRVDRLHRVAVGLDLHEPSWFVPVESLIYLKNPYHSGQILETIRALWPMIRDSKRPLVLLNGIWSAAHELRKGIMDLAERKHVIVSDHEVRLPPESRPGGAQSVHVLQVSAARENPTWLVVGIEET